MTGVYLRLAGVLMGTPPQSMPSLAPLSARELGLAWALTALSVLIGIVPGVLMAAVSRTTHLFAQF
jgi:hypothetical protein